MPRGGQRGKHARRHQFLPRRLSRRALRGGHRDERHARGVLDLRSGSRRGRSRHRRLRDDVGRPLRHRRRHFVQRAARGGDGGPGVERVSVVDGGSGGMAAANERGRRSRGMERRSRLGVGGRGAGGGGGSGSAGGARRERAARGFGGCVRGRRARLYRHGGKRGTLGLDAVGRAGGERNMGPSRFRCRPARRARARARGTVSGGGGEPRCVHAGTGRQRSVDRATARATPVGSRRSRSARGSR